MIRHSYNPCNEKKSTEILEHEVYAHNQLLTGVQVIMLIGDDIENGINYSTTLKGFTKHQQGTSQLDVDLYKDTLEAHMVTDENCKLFGGEFIPRIQNV